MRHAFNSGWAAAVAGIEKNAFWMTRRDGAIANPWSPHEVEYEEWRRGWDQGKKELEEAK